MRILVVEDHQDLAENIGDYLEGQGHVLDFALDGIGGLHLALTEDYDVIVLDVMLPVMDGLTLCRKLREEAEKYTPVLMLTARDTLLDKLSGFDAGTDDYLVKPFALEELSARLHALVKRTVQNPQTLLRVDDIVINTGTMIVRREGQPIELNRVCLKILVRLMKAHPNVVLRRDLEHALWGDMPPGSDSLRSHIYTLRRKIDKPFSHPLLHTVHGIGFKIGKADDL
ncbi:MAG: response regulator transcription factor [Nanoarchaeota archaeon]|nr:response regulator transcription factor [Nanoarchaeota archaeon]